MDGRPAPITAALPQQRLGYSTADPNATGAPGSVPGPDHARPEAEAADLSSHWQAVPATPCPAADTPDRPARSPTIAAVGAASPSAVEGSGSHSGRARHA